MRVLAFALLFATPALADPACVAAPTQDCVFAMAVDQALSQTQAGAIASGLMVTAIQQEAAGRDDWSATLDLMLPAVEGAGPEISKARDDLAFAAFAAVVSNSFDGDPPFERAPRATLRLSDLLSDISPERPERPESPEKAGEGEIFRLGLDGDMPAIEARLTAAPADARHRLALSAAKGLIHIGQVKAAFGLLRLVPSSELSAEIARLSVSHVLRTEGPDAAVALAERLANRRDRASALVIIAHHLAERGHLDAALALARDPKVSAFGFTSMFHVELLAEVYARANQRAKAIALIESTRTRFGPPIHLNDVQVIAAVVASDFAAVFPLLDQVDKFERSGLLRKAVQARWHATGPVGTEAFLILLPKADLSFALSALGRAQIDSGDLPAALATEARLAKLPEADDGLPALRRNLAPFLAEQGRVAEAVAMADALGDPWATAQVAAVMDRPGIGGNP